MMMAAAKDAGKVTGGFLSSAFVHSFAAYCVSGGDVKDASGEFWFFAECGAAVILEEGVKLLVTKHRQRRNRNSAAAREVAGVRDKGQKKEAEPSSLTEWYDAWVGRTWFMAVILITGRNFARGWVGSGLVREMAEIGGAK